VTINRRSRPAEPGYAHPVDLVHIEPHGPGIGRRKRGKGFSYFDRETGEAITDPAHLARIDAIVIPPA